MEDEGVTSCPVELWLEGVCLHHGAVEEPGILIAIASVFEDKFSGMCFL